MDFKDSSEDAAWRADVRKWLDANAERRPEGEETVPDLLGEESEDPDQLIQKAKDWQRTLYEAGYAAITWPKQYGGQDASPMQAFIFGQEMAQFDVPMGVYTIGLGMIGPTIMSHGSEEQKERFLPKMLEGSEIWCQLWSEPNAGSDVASLETRAERDEASGDWVLNGQKVWTTGAQHSKWGLIIARTDPDAPKHQGITCFIVDMEAKGVEVRPLRQINGATGFNEVFFTDVHVPDDQRVGDVNDGWRVAMTTLMNERYAIGVGGSSGGTLTPVFRLAKKTPTNGGTAFDDPAVRQELAKAYIHGRLLALTGYRSMTKIARGGIPGPEGSAMKLVGTRLASEVADAASRILGLRSVLLGDEAPDDGAWANAFLTAPGIHIAGGTDEIMKNIIGERVLGLPKEPRLDKDVPFREMRSRARQMA
ncbi:MAG TPA: acyl-CoA dehydrogenase family protein [Actinomycetota bacterium]|jgi:acyl-CoA dehydrogenase|nr:acyl-CoA dehydrogenase family protein [Actinomycetota bacterium]